MALLQYGTYVRLFSMSGLPLSILLLIFISMLIADLWKTHRQKINPTFNVKIIESFLEIMRKNGIILCEQLKNRVDSEEFDILPYVETCALDIISGKIFHTIKNRIKRI